MFNNVPRRVSSDVRSPVTPNHEESPEEDDDNVSLTSTLPDGHDPEEEFDVKDVLLEDYQDDTGMSYLVEWDGYPLHRSTWEPASNIGGELLQMWEEKKGRQRKGEEEAWTMEKYQAIMDAAYEEHLGRHRQRNAKRQRLGLPLTEPFDEEESSSSPSDDSSDEAEEDRRLSDTTAKRRHSEPQQKLAKSHDFSKSKSSSSKPQASRLRPGVTPKRSKESGPPSRLERPSFTGYQGTARKASLPGPGNSSGNRSIPPGPGQRAFRTGLTAKKSVVVPGASNVFAGGKTRKPSRKDILSDVTRKPTVFTKLSHRRLAEKYSRDKEDRPPPAPMPNLFVKLGGPRRKSSGTEQASTTSETQNHIPSPTVADLPQRKSFGNQPASATCEMHTHMPSPAVANPTLPKKPKKRKSVRFHEDDAPMFCDESTPMDIDTPEDTPTGAAPNLRPQSDVPAKSVETKVCFGIVHDSEPICVNVDGIPSTSDDPWLSEFLQTDVIRMEYTCFAKDFAFQRQNVWQYLLCSGSVSSLSSESVLESVAAHLREGLLGLYRSTPNYSVLLYPTDCDEWQSFMAEQGISSLVETGTPLKYCIFRSPVDCGPFLRRPTTRVLEEKPFSSEEDRLLWRLFGFDYQALVPATSSKAEGSPNHCFLLFPRSRQSWLAVLARWIRLCDPSCLVYTNYDSGAWLSFVSAVGERGGGIVIVHELLALSLHRIVDLWERLHHSRDTFWCLSEAIQAQPLFPSLTLPDDMVEPGQIRITTLFPRRPKTKLVVFLTPSFLTSEPQRVFEILEWFHDVFATRNSSRMKLVAAYDLHKYLEELAFQKSRERKKVLEVFKHNVAEAEITANIKGLSSDDCAYRFKAWSLATELHFLRAEAAGPSEVNEDLSSLIYAPACIDPNDEQSLVNWFGWWSSMRFDQFRGFHVVGSNSSIRFNRSQKGSRSIRIPKYSSCTINDPDIVGNEVQRMNDPTEGNEDGQEKALQEMGPAAPVAPPRPGAFQSNYISSETGWEFSNALRTMKSRLSITLYLFPVSWTDPEMSYHFGDVREEFHNLRRWWDFSWAFLPKPPFNTYVGLFYTVDEDWKPEARRASTTPTRHPWICVYRPLLGAKGPPGHFGPCELLIWDPDAEARFGNQAPKEDMLGYGQRQVIKYIREHTAEKNTGSWIQHVWYGGFKHPLGVDSPYPVDITFANLARMVSDPQKCLPWATGSLEASGYRKLDAEPSPWDAAKGSPAVSKKPSPWDGAKRPHSPTLPKPMEMDTPATSECGSDEEDEDTRIIFHPPRGKPLPPGARTKCVNHLYEKVMAAKKDAKGGGRKATEMRYDFPVTTEWYGVQRLERRGFEHVHVAPWEAVFNLLQVPPSSQQATGTPRGSNAGLGGHVESFGGGL